MLLKDIARMKFDKMSDDIALHDRIYNAGWSPDGEWTCCICGRMYGKNLKGESPYLLAREHSTLYKPS
jgi:hypothetical protein